MARRNAGEERTRWLARAGRCGGAAPAQERAEGPNAQLQGSMVRGQGLGARGLVDGRFFGDGCEDWTQASRYQRYKRVQPHHWDAAIKVVSPPRMQVSGVFPVWVTAEVELVALRHDGWMKGEAECTFPFAIIVEIGGRVFAMIGCFEPPGMDFDVPWRRRGSLRLCCPRANSGWTVC